MPKVGMEDERRRCLIDATMETIHERGYSEVTVAQIARKAGVSSGLALHYFGSKDQLLASTMHHMLRELGNGLRSRLANAHSPRERISAIIVANFEPHQFRDTVIAAWLAFYVQSRTNQSNRRLLRIYSMRLVSNLTVGLCHFMSREDARRVAEGTASMIDGVWLRQALRDKPGDPETAITLVEEYVSFQIEQARQNKKAAALHEAHATPDGSNTQ
ncbi:MAG: transcriptional regulator BetI [Rhodobacteraceae bacterium]|nr:transcriptional regulator BetI [Paracoccaceae bacterium]